MKKRFRITKFLIRVYRQWKALAKSSESYTPSYRIVNIEKDVKGEYHVTVQLIGKNSLIKSAPEELLADDAMVNCFSPADIRTLTYLGYLGINSPKYKILAKQLSEKNEQVLFAIHKKGDEAYQVVTADEIAKNAEMIDGLSQKEAYLVGLTTANEQAILEKRQKEILLKQLKEEA